MNVKERKREQRNRSYQKHREEILSRARARYASDEEYATLIKNRVKKYAKSDPERLRRTKAKEKEKNSTRYSLYWRWRNMMDRCTNPSSKDFKNYGARGITVHSRLTAFEGYREYVTQLPRPEGFVFTQKFHLDRINNNLGYVPGNLRWVTVKQNMENSRNPKNNPLLKKGA